MKILRRISLAFVMLVISVMAMAVPAKPGLVRTLRLTDGTSLVARLVGDEFGHYWLGSDGKSYQANADGITYRAVDAETVKARAAVRRQKVNARRTQRMARRKIGDVSNFKGTKKGIIILVNFSDVSFKTTNAYFTRVVNEENFSDGSFKGSMADYFKKQSLGQFELDFDVVGPVTVSKNQSYYGANDEEGNDKYPATMVIEALKLANSQVNYANYDWDGNGEVEQVYVVYAGMGEADGGAASTIWPHEWDLASANSYGDGSGAQKLDGVTINTYACGPELSGSGKLGGIGTMCHEFSHCLGYPDFYDTDYSGGQGMGYWDLMDSGSYNDDGFQPAGYTSYERMLAGWATPTELTKTLQVNNMPDLQSSGQSYVIYNPGNANEYFLLENRQKTGWDESLPGAGLLILHVDYSATDWVNNTPNDVPSHQRMTWIAADNKYQYTTYDGLKYYTTTGMVNDPFPYGSVNAFGANTTPAAKLYNKNTDGTYYLNTSVINITQNTDGTVSFKYQGETNVATPTFSPAAGRYSQAQTVSISCATSGATIYYTLDGKEPTTSSAVYSSPLTINETTTVKAMAVAEGEESAVATAKYTIGGTLLFYEGLSNYGSTGDGSTSLLADSKYFNYLYWETVTKIYAGGTSNAYSEGGCLKFGSGSATGSMTTGKLSLTGDATLTFYLKQYGSDTGKLNVSVTGATADVTEFTPSGEWTQCIVNLTGATGSVTITLATSSKRAYVDEIEIVAGNSTTPATPVIVADESLAFSTPVGTPQTKTFEVLSENLTEDITLTLNDPSGVFSLGATTISKTEEDAMVSVTFTPTAAGSFTGSVILTSAGADGVTVDLSATAIDNTPVIVADESLSFDTYVGITQTKTFEVLSENLTENITLTLNDPSGVFSLGATTISKSDAEATVSVTFTPTAVGSFTGTVTLSSAGAEAATVALSGKASEAPEGSNFQLVSSVDDMVSGKRYIIACGGAEKAAGSLDSQILTSNDVTVNGEMITIDDNVSVFVLRGDQTSGWSFKNESNGEYLYATTTKKLAYGTEAQTWTLSDGTAGVIMTFGSYGTMLCNTGSPRFTTYTSSPTSAMIQANLYVEVGGEVQKNDVVMGFSASEATATLGKDFTAPTLSTTPAGLTVTYASSDTQVAAVDATTGEVTLLGEGTAVITATFAGNDSYNSATASYTLTVEAAGQSDNYELVTDASTLVAGDQILIAYVNTTDAKYMAMSTTQKANNRAASAVTLNADNTLASGDDTQVITLEVAASGNFLFNVGGGYLYAASSGYNYLKTETKADANAEATISISSEDGKATITFQGTNTRNLMRYNPNNDSPIFSCYASTSTVGSLPQIYRKVADASLKGDVNRDGQVSIADVTAVANIILGKTENYDSDAADVNGDNEISIADVTAVVNIILGK